MKNPTLLLVGAGGHARACIDVIEQHNVFRIAGLVGLADQVGSRILGYQVLGSDADLAALVGTFRDAVVVVGQIESPEKRIQLFELIRAAGGHAPSVVSPEAYVSRHATVGEGSVVMHGAIINAGAAVGRNCIINSNALIEHDAVVGDHCHISTGAILNGGVHVGVGTFVGSACTVLQGVEIGARSVIGMGRVVRENHPSTVTPTGGKW